MDGCAEQCLIITCSFWLVHEFHFFGSLRVCVCVSVWQMSAPSSTLVLWGLEFT